MKCSSDSMVYSPKLLTQKKREEEKEHMKKCNLDTKSSIEKSVEILQYKGFVSFNWTKCSFIFQRLA